AVGRTAAPASGAVTVAAACVGALWGVAAYVVHGADEPSAADVLAGIPERDRVVRPVAPDEGAPRRQDAAWQVSVRLPRMRGLALFGGLVFGATAWLSWGTTPGWWTALVGLAGALFCAVMLAWSSVLVRVDPTGLMVRSMVFPVSLMTVAASDVLGAGSVEVDPMDWGGWGLQWSARHTAVVVRGGPGIVVHRRSGRPLALEVPAGAVAASEGAALLRRVAGWAAPC
ncbi:MAG: hypothetical protein WA892_15070, partial [Ornithinimicrobium sp.]